MMLVMVPTEERGDMMLVVVPTLVLTSSAELSLWILFPLFDLGGHQSYLQGVQRRPRGCSMTG